MTERCPKIDEHAFAEGTSQPSELKKERRSTRDKIRSSQIGFCNRVDEGVLRPMEKKKKRGSNTESDTATVSLKEVTKSSKSRKSRGDEAADLGAVIVSALEQPKPGKKENERRPKTGSGIALISEKRLKKKDKKPRKKPECVRPANTYGTNGLSAMIEPWVLLKTVVKTHRDEVHVLKDIMDLQACKTGDRTMLHKLEKLLTQIDKEKSSNSDRSSISDTKWDDPSLSV